MDFGDKLLIQLASASGRTALLGQDALRAMVTAAFDVATAPVEGPYAIEVERADLGLEIARSVQFDGEFVAVPGALPGSLRLRSSNFGGGTPLRVDALWRGALIARQVPQDDRIAALSGGFTLLDIDREIIGDLGALPAGPALEAERRARLLARLKADASQAELIDDRALDAMLAAGGIADVATLLGQRGGSGLARFSLAFTAPAHQAVPLPIRLPVTVAVLIRSAPIGFSALLAESRAIRSALGDDPAALPPPVPALSRRVSVLVAWVLDATLFDDGDWPGADRAARIAAAATLLSGQGIALATA